MTPEGAVKKACEDLLEAERIRYFRMNAGDRFGIGKNGRRWRIRGHEKGTPDLLALPRMRVTAFYSIPVPLWVETKAAGKMPSQEQLQFADEARNNGEYWLLIDDVTELQDWLKEHRAR